MTTTSERKSDATVDLGFDVPLHAFETQMGIRLDDIQPKTSRAGYPTSELYGDFSVYMAVRNRQVVKRARRLMTSEISVARYAASAVLPYALARFISFSVVLAVFANLTWWVATGTAYVPVTGSLIAAIGMVLLLRVAHAAASSHGDSHKVFDEERRLSEPVWHSQSSRPANEVPASADSFFTEWAARS